MSGQIMVVGAGMAGLLAAAILRNRCHSVVEALPYLPNNHSAVLRFRSSIVGDTLGIEFKKVKVLIASEPYKNPLADAVAYSLKTNNTATLRSIMNAGGELRERYIAPTDLIQRMEAMSKDKIKYRTNWNQEEWLGPVISTMPMQALMRLLNYPLSEQIEFPSMSGWNVRVKLAGCDLYASLYVPSPEFPGSRISIMGDEMIIEIQGPAPADPEQLINDAMNKCGLNEAQYVSHEMKRQLYSKILPIDDELRKRFIIWASEKHNVYSLGRFATWRPGLLLDDVVDDVRHIMRLIDGQTSYRNRL